MASVPGTIGNDFIIPSGNNRYFGGGGSDTYIISTLTMAAGATAEIIDTEGDNVIQLVDGLHITSSVFTSNAVQLNLSNGAKMQILGASRFSFQVGANAPGGDTAPSESYADFASKLGVSPLPTSGQVTGADYVVPTSAFLVRDVTEGGRFVAANGVQEVFLYAYDTVGGRATTASGASEATIAGFNPSEDVLRFDNLRGGNQTPSQFLATPGVVPSENSVQVPPTTSIHFDPNATSGVVGGVTVVGLADSAFTHIHLEIV